MRTVLVACVVGAGALLLPACGTSNTADQGTTSPSTGGASGAGGAAGVDYSAVCRDACAAPASCRGASFSVDKCIAACKRESAGQGVLDPMLAVPYYEFLASKGAGWSCELNQGYYGWERFAETRKEIVLKQANVAMCSDYVVQYCVAQLNQTKDQAVVSCIGRMKFGEPFKSQLKMCMTPQEGKSLDCISTTGCFSQVSTPTTEVWLGIDEPGASP